MPAPMHIIFTLMAVQWRYHVCTVLLLWSLSLSQCFIVCGASLLTTPPSSHVVHTPANTTPYITATDKQTAAPRASPPPFRTWPHPHRVPRNDSLWSQHLINSPVLPTNTFFTNFFLGGGTEPVAIDPYLVKATEHGLSICYPHRVVQTRFIMSVFTTQLVMTAKEQFQTPKIQRYDQSSVHLQWEQPHHVILDGRKATATLEAPLVRGSPYVSVIYRNATMVIKCPLSAILSVHTIKSSTTTTNSTNNNFPLKGTQFAISLNDGSSWHAFWFSENHDDMDIILAWSMHEVRSETPQNGALRLVRIVSEDHLPILNQHAGVIPIGFESSFKVDPSSRDVHLSFKWTCICKNTNDTSPSADLLSTTPLMLALPHHIDSFVPSMDSAIVKVQTPGHTASYRTISGTLTLVTASQWYMVESGVNITWTAPRTIPEKHIPELQQRLRRDVATFRATPPRERGTYSFGKRIAALARLALIADEIGLSAEAATARDILESSLEPWLQGNNANALVYDSTWGGIVSTDGARDPHADFGLGNYNDSPYHFGYFIMAAAVIARDVNRTPFIDKHHDALYALMRTFGNDPSVSGQEDRFFPQQPRGMDWFKSHSWSSGLYVFGDGKNTESTSENVNAWYAMMLFGIATGDKAVEDVGRALLAVELRGAHTYWQIKPSQCKSNEKKAIYDDLFCDNGVVGVLWSTKVDYATWFGNQVEYIHCIQMLPWTPISEVLLPEEWLQESYQVLKHAWTRDDPPMLGEWKAYVLSAEAIVDAPGAMTRFRASIDGIAPYDGGQTSSNTLWWLVTRSSWDNDA